MPIPDFRLQLPGYRLQCKDPRRIAARKLNRILYPVSCILLAAIPAAGAGPLPDPTLPPRARPAQAEAAQPLPTPTLIVRTADQAMAWLEDRLVQPGDRIGRMRVVRIEDDAVVVHTPQGQQRLTLYPPMQHSPKPAVDAPRP